MKIVFYGSASPVAYSDETLLAARSGIGGAEASLTHVATGLAANHEVAVVQARRDAGDEVRSGAFSGCPFPRPAT